MSNFVISGVLVARSILHTLCHNVMQASDDAKAR